MRGRGAGRGALTNTETSAEKTFSANGNQPKLQAISTGKGITASGCVCAVQTRSMVLAQEAGVQGDIPPPVLSWKPPQAHRRLPGSFGRSDLVLEALWGT